MCRLRRRVRESHTVVANFSSRAARAVGERDASSGHRDPWRLLARALRLDGSRAPVRSGNPAGTGDVEPGIPTHWKSRWRMAGDARRCANGRGAFGKDRGGAITRSETRGGDGALCGRTPSALAGETERDCAEGHSSARSGGGFAPCVGAEAEQHGGGGFVGGSPQDLPDRYRSASPIELAPLGVAQRVLHGANDDVVPLEISRQYVVVARKSGDDSKLIEVAGAGHFD